MTHMKNLITQYQTLRCEDSFNEVYATVSDKLLNSARQQARQRQLSWADVESETYFVLLKAIESYDVTIGEFEPYLYQALKRCLMMMQREGLTLLRYNDQYAADAPTSTGNLPEQAAIEKEQRQLLEDVKSDADPKSRQALEAYAATTSFREAAKLIGIEHKTVKSRIEKLSAARQHVSLNDYMTA